MISIKQRLQIGKKASLITILICLLCFFGCNPGESEYTKYESLKIDSLINLHYVNDRTVIVRFGYDALTAIKTTEGIVIVDAGISTSLTNRYKKLVEKEFDQKNFLYVINTHGHHDHVRGNSIFPNAQVIGHENCRIDATRIENSDSTLIRIGRIITQYDQVLRQLNPDTQEWEDNFTQKIRYLSAYVDISKNLSLRLSDITLSDSLCLKSGDTTFEMIYFGKFHSNSDILIFVPEIRTLFIGDIFSKNGRPSMSNQSESDADRWMQALKWIKIRTNNICTIIDGHGQILSMDDLEHFANSLLSKYSDIKNK